MIPARSACRESIVVTGSEPKQTVLAERCEAGSREEPASKLKKDQRAHTLGIFLPFRTISRWPQAGVPGVFRCGRG